MAGRKPHPTVVHLLRGNPSKKTFSRKEPVPAGDLHRPPDWLTPEQLALWNEALDCAPANLLKRLDASVLATWCVARDLHRQATLKVAALGLIVKSPAQGEPIQNPYLPIINKQALIMLRAAAELGFSPSSRSRVQVEAAPVEGNPFAALARA